MAQCGTMLSIGMNNLWYVVIGIRICSPPLFDTWSHACRKCVFSNGFAHTTYCRPFAPSNLRSFAPSPCHSFAHRNSADHLKDRKGAVDTSLETLFKECSADEAAPAAHQATSDAYMAGKVYYYYSDFQQGGSLVRDVLYLERRLMRLALRVQPY